MSDEQSIEFDHRLPEFDTELSFAVGFEEADGTIEIEYFPNSQCRVYEKNQKIYAPDWLLRKKGLI